MNGDIFLGRDTELRIGSPKPVNSPQYIGALHARPMLGGIVSFATFFATPGTNAKHFLVLRVI